MMRFVLKFCPSTKAETVDYAVSVGVISPWSPVNGWYPYYKVITTMVIRPLDDPV